IMSRIGHAIRIAAIALVLLLPALALGQSAGIGGTWKAVVLKKKDDKVPLTKDGYSLLIAIDDAAKTWEATARTKGGERKTAGTFRVDAQHLVFVEKNGATHALKAHVAGNQLI